MPKPRVPLAQRFWAKVDKRGSDECWPWLAARDKDGYGVLDKGRAARVSLALVLGRPLLPGECALHRCDTPPCVNPKHLYAGTDADNRADKMAKGRQARGDAHGRRLHPERYPRGEGHPIAKLSTMTVMEIRRALLVGDPQRAIAARYGVSQKTVQNIKKGRTWRHVAAYEPEAR